MDIPPNVRIPLCIEQGSVFNFMLEVEGPSRQSKNRFFVVVNREPKTDTVLLMVTSTSQVEKKKEFARRAGISEGTIVTVLPSECPIFKTESAFNCNDVYEVKMSDLVRKIGENGSMDYTKIPNAILKKLIAGITMSPRIAEGVKKML